MVVVVVLVGVVVVVVVDSSSTRLNSMVPFSLINCHSGSSTTLTG
ncbi:MAG: hypothetical protein ACXABU_14195 [Candidatus Hodarchaeales archaeon]